MSNPDPFDVGTADEDAPALPRRAASRHVRRAPPTCPYLRDLNREQRLAVETSEGPLLVLAGAGTTT